MAQPVVHVVSSVRHVVVLASLCLAAGCGSADKTIDRMPPAGSSTQATASSGSAAGTMGDSTGGIGKMKIEF